MTTPPKRGHLRYKVKHGGQVKIGDATITIRRTRELDIGHYVEVLVDAPLDVHVEVVRTTYPKKGAD